MSLETLTEPPRQIVSDVATVEHRPSEQRQHQRSRIAAMRPTVVHFGRRNAGLLEDLGLGGMRVRALGRQVSPGATVRLGFQLPGSLELMRTDGLVAWVNDAGEVGIQFVKLPEAKARRLQEWVARNQILNAARGFLRIADDWQPRLDLIAELTRTITGAGGVELVVAGHHALTCGIAEGLPIRSTITAPIEEGERIIGHLEICSTEFGAFDEADLRVVSVLAAVLSEMVRLPADAQQEPPRKPPLTTRIVNRMGGIFPRTIRVRVVF